VRLGGAPVVVLAAASWLAPLLVVPASAHAAIEPDVTCVELEDSGTEDTYLTDRPSVPLTALGITAAHERMNAPGLPGEGVKVAVIDSGIDAGPPLLDVQRGPSYANLDAVVDYHGTAVAGLIAAKPRGDQPTGIAPGATVVDVRVYDDDDTSDEGAAPVEIDRLIRGIEWVTDHAEDEGIGVATIALRVGWSRALGRAVRDLHREADVVVVAASGNRPTDEGDPLLSAYGELRPGEDAARQVYPAGFRDDVVAVSATIGGHPDEVDGADARDFVLQSSAIDVAVPTYDAVSLGPNASTCLLPDVATSWAAAEVSGVVALLRAQYPHDSADQIVARLVETAGGASEDRNPVVGAGVVQPVEALTRPLTPGHAGGLDRAPADARDLPPAAAPRPQADPLAAARDDAVWFGLLGGGAVVLALLLRPVLARRRG